MEWREAVVTVCPQLYGREGSKKKREAQGERLWGGGLCLAYIQAQEAALLLWSFAHMCLWKNLQGYDHVGRDRESGQLVIVSEVMSFYKPLSLSRGLKPPQKDSFPSIKSINSNGNRYLGFRRCCGKGLVVLSHKHKMLLSSFKGCIINCFRREVSR